MEDYTKSPYFHVAYAPDLKGKDRFIYRLLEMLPGFLAWGTIITIIILSIYKPIWAAYFIIAFDFYWLLKTINLGFHHRHNWKRMMHNINADWLKMISNLKYEHIYHMVMLPYVHEGKETILGALESLKNTSYNTKKLIVIVGAEERMGDDALNICKEAVEQYSDVFGHLLVTQHTLNPVTERPGKGANISYMAERGRIEVLDKYNIPYENVLVSAFDVDTVVYPQYFLCLTWYFLTTEDPYNASYQPVPLYNNNIWDANPVSRVAALSSTYWQMIQQERPEKLGTFSSHAVNFRTLRNANYWQRNMVSEDSRIFFNLFLANNGNYRVVPISYPVSMDANMGSSFLQTMKNIYKQHRRWMWGVENIPYLIFNFIKHKKIPLKKKLALVLNQIEGFWSLATNPIVILLLGWLPLILGGDAFRATVLSYNLPIITRSLMIVAMAGLILSSIVGVTLVPKMPKDYKRRAWNWFIMVSQWIIVPFTIIFFGAIPGLEAQTRLMFGRYMGFWVTPKERKVGVDINPMAKKA